MLKRGIVVLALLISAIVVFPIGLLLVTSLWSSQPGTPGHLTVANYSSFLGDPLTWSLLRNSLVFTFGSSAIGLSMAAAMAWFMASVDIRGRSLLRILPLTPILLPPLLKDPAWIELFSPRTGLANLGLMHLLGLHQPPFNIYSLLGMVTMVAFNVAPIPYAILLGPFEAIDRRFEEASWVSGAGTLRTLRQVILPILLPALMSALALTTLIVSSAIETPLLVGEPAQIYVYMSSIYDTVNFGQTSRASAQSSLFLIVAAGLLVWYVVATRRERRFVTVSGRGQRALSSLPRAASVLLFVLFLSYFTLSTLLPLAVNVLVSLVPFYTVTLGFPFSHLTLANYQAIVSTPNLGTSVINSAILAAIVTVCALVTGGLLAFVSLKTKLWGRRVFEAIATIPIAIPPIVFSITLLLASLLIPGGRLVYGTFVPLVVAETVVFTPFAVRIVAGALIQVHDDLIEASTLTGASELRTARKILIPLLWPAMSSAAALIFILSYRELGAVILLATANTPLVPTVTYSLWQSSTLNEVAALNVVATVLPLTAAGCLFALSVRPPWRRSRPERSGAAVRPPGVATVG